MPEIIDCWRCNNGLLMPDGSLWCGLVMKPTILVTRTEDCKPEPGKFKIKTLEELLRERAYTGDDSPRKGRRRR